MSEESTTPDLVRLLQQSVEAGNRRDLHAALERFAPDAVWDMSAFGMGVFHGRRAIHAFLEDWYGTFAEVRQDAEEIRDLGGGVTITVIVQGGHPPGGEGRVQFRYASVTTWKDGLAVRITIYTDIDEARAAAARLAEDALKALGLEA
jgi:ketosteroid isomerase-like protein